MSRVWLDTSILAKYYVSQCLDLCQYLKTFSFSFLALLSSTSSQASSCLARTSAISSACLSNEEDAYAIYSYVTLYIHTM